MGCGVSKELRMPKKKKKRAQFSENSLVAKSNSDDINSCIVHNSGPDYDTSKKKAADSEPRGTTVEDHSVSAAGPSTRILSKRISDKVEYFEQLSRQILEEPKLKRLNSAYSKWKVEDLPQRNVTAPVDWQYIPKERLMTNEQRRSLSAREMFQENTRVDQRVTSWSDIVQQLRNEHFQETYLLDKSLKRRSSKLGA